VARLLRSRNASSDGRAFVSLSSSDIVRASVGSGEKMVVLAFETAQMNAPSVVFIDEFQALFTERSSGGSRRLSSTLLQCMDDAKQWRDADANAASTGQNMMDCAGRMVVLAATNTPWMVDTAFVRPGRFEVFFDSPTVSLQSHRAMKRSELAFCWTVESLCCTCHPSTRTPSAFG
jgi:SpoVK/Ycf46/Vps4 family AAA+-type ATPase